MTQTSLGVPEISCDHCKISIEGAISPLDGVDFVEVAIEGRTVAVTYDGGDCTLQAIVAAIEEQGYEVARRASHSWLQRGLRTDDRIND